VVSGSPRKNGDTSKLVKQIAQQMSSKADIQFEYIFLREQNLEFCKGCMQCMRKGEEKCPIKDDALVLRERLLSADGMIFCSPVYEHQVTASLKNFFDRFVHFMHRPAFLNKPALIISSTELSGLEETMKYMAFPISCWGFSVIDKIGIIPDAFKVEGAYREKMLYKIGKAVESYIAFLNSPSLKKPDLAAVQFFNKLKTKIIIHREKLPYDYEYWKQKGWLDKQFFYETQINPIKGFLGRLPVRIIKLVMKKKVGPEVFSKMFTEPLTTFAKESV
jgi:multimeric flavodoxin WrbA